MEKKRTKEFKEYVVKLVLEEHRKVTDLSFELEIGASSIRRWIKEYREKLASGNDEVKYVTPSDLKKIESAYEKKMRALEEENAILKKAMHIFTKSQE